MKLVKCVVASLVVILLISMFMAFPIFPAAATMTLPRLEVRPTVIGAPEEGADVAIEIWATNVVEDWEIIGFQFSVPFNTQLLAPAPYEEGAFIEAFVNSGETVFYAVVSDIPYEPNWFLTTVAVMIMPDANALYHAPFPSEEGRLITLHYTALEPEFGTSMPIDIIDILILDQNLEEVPYATPLPGVYGGKIDFDPDTLHLMSKGRWITCYIELPEGYDVNDIDVSSITLDCTIPVDPEAPTAIGDHDEDGVPDLMVKFDRATVSELILSRRITNGYVTLTITGEVDGAPFRGEDTIRVLMRGGGTRGHK